MLRVGVSFSGDGVWREVRVWLLVLLVALWTLGSVVGFLFPCMLRSWFVASLPKVVICRVCCRVFGIGLLGPRIDIVSVWWV